MINSIWSGISGLKAHQATMDVIGNDISNVNTIAFKQSNVSFKDALYKSVGDQQVGLGVSVGKVAQDFSGGMLRATGVRTHMAISGDGFFVLKDASGGNPTYSRAGDFELSYDSTENNVRLMSSEGRYLYGTAGGTAGSATTLIELPADIQDMMVSREGVISYIDGAGNLVEDAFTLDIATFAGQGGLKQLGGNQYAMTSASGAANFSASNRQVVQGYLENSNVDLAGEFTEMIMAERGFQANSRTVTTSDSILQELLNLKR
jgi:flagellar hook protein FlgE